MGGGPPFHSGRGLTHFTVVGTGGLAAPRDVIVGSRVGLDAPGKTVSEAPEEGW